MSDVVRHDSAGAVVLVGGTGVVGQRLVGLLRTELPAVTVTVASRSSSRDEALRAKWPDVDVLRLDLSGPAFLFEARLVVGLVNDPDDRLLTACLRGGVPYLDITRWTSRLSAGVTRAAVTAPGAPVIFSSGWMGGVVPRVAAALAHEVGGAKRIDTSILYDLQDRAGDDAVEFMDRLWVPFEVTDGARARMVDPMADGRVVHIDSRRTRVVRLDTPEQATLPMTLAATSVSTRIGFTSAWATWGVMLLKRLGVFHALRGDCHRSTRHALLKSAGTGGVARLRVDVQGRGGERTVELRDALGQAHLTAVGALLSVQWALSGTLQPGVHFPEQAPHQTVLEDLKRLGVEVTRSTPRTRLAA